ncbi:MAG TPA: hypothetical protein VFB82_09165, partial [Blastocatellia bacterium]|nr:hypothetical protein [Blastocatellia bacterium]
MKARHVSALNLLPALAVLILAGWFGSSPATAQDAFTGQWIIEPSSKSDRLHLSLAYPSHGRNYGHNTSGFGITLDRLQGLTQAQMMSSGSRVVFQLVRDAGTLNCEGWFKEGKGSGHFVFAPNTRFAAELAQRGYQAPTEAQQFSMTLSDISLAFIDELKAQGYERPSIEQLVR